MKKIAILIFIIWINDLREVTHLTLPNNNESILLKCNFRKYFPHFFSIGKNENMYLGDGHMIYKFDPKGNLVSEKAVPGTDYSKVVFSDMIVQKRNDNILKLVILRNISTFNMNTLKMSNLFKCYGSSIKEDEYGNCYSLYQYYDSVENKVLNKIKVIPLNGKSFDYPSKLDFGANQFDIIGNEIIMYVPSIQQVIILPVINKNLPVKIYKVALPNDQAVNFLGTSNGKNILQYYDYKKKQDFIIVYDSNFKHKAQYVLNFKDEVSNGFKTESNGDWYAQYPSGNIYSFSNQQIFILRFSEKETRLYNLLSLCHVK